MCVFFFLHGTQIWIPINPTLEKDPMKSKISPESHHQFSRSCWNIPSATFGQTRLPVPLRGRQLLPGRICSNDAGQMAYDDSCEDMEIIMIWSKITMLHSFFMDQVPSFMAKLYGKNPHFDGSNMVKSFQDWWLRSAHGWRIWNPGSKTPEGMPDSYIQKLKSQSRAPDHSSNSSILGKNDEQPIRGYWKLSSIGKLKLQQLKHQEFKENIALLYEKFHRCPKNSVVTGNCYWPLPQLFVGLPRSPTTRRRPSSTHQTALCLMHWRSLEVGTRPTSWWVRNMPDLFLFMVSLWRDSVVCRKFDVLCHTSPPTSRFQILAFNWFFHIFPTKQFLNGLV